MSDPIVETAHGRVQGVVTRESLIFKGVPYAAAPVGRRRWRPPEPPEPWAGVRPADEFAPICHQKLGPIEQATGMLGVPMSEDCLFLNLWTPAADGAKRPVMVWIHGGGFIGGAGSMPFYDGRRLADRGDVVVVTFNYRVGAFGFLYLADLGGEAWASAGNCGLLDQLAVLRWVRDNIAEFGGDPDNVTVFGESAGAFSIADLLATPAASGLFHRAILQSGNPVAVRDREAATVVARDVLAPLGLDRGSLHRLYDVPAEDLLEAGVVAARIHGNFGLPFMPVVDQIVLPAHPQDAAEAGQTLRVPIITGTNAEEMRLFTVIEPHAYVLAYEEIEGRVALLPDVGPERAGELVASYREQLDGMPPGLVLAAIYTDWGFTVPALRHAEAQAAAGLPVWMYRFTFATPTFGGMLGACHALEIPFVFDVLDRPGVNMFTGDDPARHDLADAMGTAWLSFARSGDPGWPQYEPAGRRATQRFDLESGVIDDPYAAVREGWKDVVRR